MTMRRRSKRRRFAQAGAEPATDLKRHIAAACCEVGLVVAKAMRRKLIDGPGWGIRVDAVPSCWSHTIPAVAVLGYVPPSGEWPEQVQMFACLPTSDESPSMIAMCGRRFVNRSELITALHVTLEELDVVMKAFAAGNSGPHRFGTTCWELTLPWPLCVPGI
jgi:hypothetical protein